MVALSVPAGAAGVGGHQHPQGAHEVDRVRYQTGRNLGPGQVALQVVEVAQPLELGDHEVEIVPAPGLLVVVGAPAVADHARPVAQQAVTDGEPDAGSAADTGDKRGPARERFVREGHPDTLEVRGRARLVRWSPSATACLVSD